MTNHILDGVHCLWWPSIFPGGKFVSAEWGATEFTTPLYNPDYNPGYCNYWLVCRVVDHHGKDHTTSPLHCYSLIWDIQAAVCYSIVHVQVQASLVINNGIQNQKI